MSIKPLTIDTSTGAVKETLTAVKGKLGMVPNLFGVMAKAPAILNSYLQVSENLKGGSINAKIGEQIAIAVANKNSCEYCLSAHTAIGKMVGVDANDLATAQVGRATDSKAQAAITLALEINRTHGENAAPAVAKAIAAGLTEQEVLEVAGHVALNILTNSINGLAETVVDFPKVGLSKAAA
jgi:AhpD family alkylhydroperoxidase